MYHHPGTMVTSWNPIWVSEPHMMPTMASQMMQTSYLARPYPRYHPHMMGNHPFMRNPIQSIPTMYMSESPMDQPMTILMPRPSYGMNEYRSIPLHVTKP